MLQVTRQFLTNHSAFSSKHSYAVLKFDYGTRPNVVAPNSSFKLQVGSKKDNLPVEIVSEGAGGMGPRRVKQLKYKELFNGIFQEALVDIVSFLSFIFSIMEIQPACRKVHTSYIFSQNFVKINGQNLTVPIYKYLTY